MPLVLEIEKLFSQGYKNIAQGKIAKQSGTSTWSKPDDASRAVSGDFPVDFAFHTNYQTTPWWELDLGNIYDADFVAIHNRIDGCQDRADHIIVKVSMDGNTWKIVHQGDVRFGSFKKGFPLILEISNQPIRYLNLSLPDIGCLHLSQVQVFAKKENFWIEDLEANFKRKELNKTLLGDICICGTSNSLIKEGYSKAIKKNDRISSVNNRSLGSSHNTLLPYAINQSDLETADFLIVDFCVNEELARLQNLCNLSLSNEIIKFTIKNCAVFNCIPVFLLLPIKSNANNNQIIAEYRKILSQYNIPFLDVENIIEYLGTKLAKPREWFFKDWAHLKRDVARLIGSILCEIIPENRQSWVSFSNENIGHYYYMSVIDQLNSIEVINRRTSIRTVNFAVLRPGLLWELFLPEDHEIIGLVFNMSQSNGLLSIDGEELRIKDLRSSYFDPTQDMWLISLQILSPVKSKQGRIIIECLRDTNENIETSEIIFKPANFTREDIFIELAGFIIRDNTTSYNIPVLSPPASDLTAAALTVLDEILP